MTDLTFDEVRQRVGTPPKSFHRARAWWIGTDATLEGLARYQEQHTAWKEALKELCLELGCSPEAVWIVPGGRGWGPAKVCGFLPCDPDDLAPGLRLADNGYAVPALRYKAGKEIAQRIEAVDGLAVDLGEEIGGLTGDLWNPATGMPSWPHFIAPMSGGSHPLVVTTSNPDSPESCLKVDEDRWTQLPLSWLHRLVEEGEGA